MPRLRRVAISTVASVALGLLGAVAVGIVPGGFAVWYLAAATPWLVATDIREHRLPNRLVLPGIAAGLVSCAGEWIADGRPPIVPVIAGVAYPAFLLLMHVTGGMGMGDVKLGAALGLASWNLSLAILSPVIAFLAGGLVALALLLAGRRKTRIAFGPYLLGGYWLAVTLDSVARLAS